MKQLVGICEKCREKLTSRLLQRLPTSKSVLYSEYKRKKFVLRDSGVKGHVCMISIFNG